MLKNNAVGRLEYYSLTEGERSELEKAFSWGIDYKFYPQFQEKGAFKALFATEIPQPNMNWFLKTAWGPVTGGKKQVLTPGQEKQLFCQYNWCKFKIAQQYLKKNPDISTAVYFLRLKNKIKEKIVGYNLALVLNLVRKSAQKNLSTDDLISTGSMILLHAIDGFDTGSGNKFSTYLTWSVPRAFAKESKKESRIKEFFPVHIDTSTSGDKGHLHELIAQPEQAEESEASRIRHIISENLANLSSMEIKVIKSRYPMDKHNEFKRLTLSELCSKLKCSKSNLSRLEKTAIVKIRAKMMEMQKQN